MISRLRPTWQKPIPVLFAAIVALFAQGCDSVEDSVGESASTSVNFDMRSDDAKSGLAECRSVAEQVELTVPDADYSESVVADPFRQLVVFEDVTVPRGVVTFESNVYSNYDSLLFSGTSTVEISGMRFADVSLRLRKLAGVPVMEVCLATDALILSIQNRGLGKLDWQIVPPESGNCVDENGDERECLTFSSQEGLLDPGEATNVEIRLLAPPQPTSYTILLESINGQIEIDIAPEDS